MVDETAKGIEATLAGLPAAVDKEPEVMTPSELLQETTRYSLIGCYKLAKAFRADDPELDIKRINAHIALTNVTLRATLRVMEEGFRAQRSDKIDKLLAELEAMR